MRRVEWLFVVSVALFVSGIAFIIASGTSRPRAAAAPTASAPTVTPVASIRQVMSGIVMPNATVVWDAVGTTLTAGVVKEAAPKNEMEWSAVTNSAAALVEAGNLLLLGNRVVDRADWIAMTRDYIDQATSILKAAEGKNAEGVFLAGGALNTTCDACHDKYQRR